MSDVPTRTYRPPEQAYPDSHLDAGLAEAFGPEATRWSCPPVLRENPSDLAPIVQPASAEMPRRSPDRFQLHGEIARGGMGVILKGHDPSLGRDLAFKVLKRELVGKPSAEQRFVEEAQIGGQLQHPGIVPVYELDRFDDCRPYFTMKLVNGRTLSELLDERSNPTAGRGTLLGYFLKVCETVAYAHSRGVIHRDLKPANVMVGHFGEVLVMDWGLAKVLPRGEAADGVEEATRAAPPEGVPIESPTAIRTIRTGLGSDTLAGSVFGTPAFMSPEQAGGEIDKLDERADVFGLGAILCVILTGQPPYAESDFDAARLMAIRGQLDGACSRLEGSADPELVRLCTQCLAPAREDRPRHAGEVQAAVAAFLGAVEDRARLAEIARAAAVVKSVEERKRRRVQAALGLTAAVAVGLVAFGLWWHDRQETATRQERQTARDAARLQAASTLDRAETALRQDRPAEADAALDRAGDYLSAADDADLEKRHHALRADRATVAELDRVWARSNAILDERAPGPSPSKGGLWFDDESARKGYPAALADLGLWISSESADDVVNRIRRSPIRDRLVTALDDWLAVAMVNDRPRLYDVLARVDPDPARSEVRRAHVETDRLPSLFTKPPPPEALRVAARAATHPAVNAGPALAVLRAAALRDPADFRTQCAAGVAAFRAGDMAAVPGYLRAALALHPNNFAAVYNLGVALHQLGQVAESAPLFLRAVELDPTFGSAYISLAEAIKLGADPAPAVAHFEAAIRRDPTRPLAHFGLGMALRDSRRMGDRPRAVAAFRKAIDLDDTSALAHNYLGYVSNRIDDRIKCYRRAIELDPTFAFPHYNLAGCLRQKGDLSGAEAEYRAALKLLPTHTLSRHGLASALADQEKWDEAADEYRDLCQLLPTSWDGYFGLMQVMTRQGMNVAAVGVFDDLERRNQTWAYDPWLSLRYNAACAAALAGTGQGQDTPAADGRATLRRRALEWLRADFTAYRWGFGTNPPRVAVEKIMDHWLADPDLTLVRLPMAVGLLPADERDGWKAFWADVRALRAGAAPK